MINPFELSSKLLGAKDTSCPKKVDNQEKNWNPQFEQSALSWLLENALIEVNLMPTNGWRDNSLLGVNWVFFWDNKGLGLCLDPEFKGGRCVKNLIDLIFLGKRNQKGYKPRVIIDQPSDHHLFDQKLKGIVIRANKPFLNQLS